MTPCDCVFLPLRVMVWFLIWVLPGHSVISACDAMCLRVSSSSYHGLSSSGGVTWS